MSALTRRDATFPSSRTQATPSLSAHSGTCIMPEQDILAGSVLQFHDAQVRGILPTGKSQTSAACAGSRQIRPVLTHRFTGYLAIYPRVFAEGTEVRDYCTCTVHNLGYIHPPMSPDYVPNAFDFARSKGEGWIDYLRPLEGGEAHMAFRGKECCLAAGTVCSHLSWFFPF